MKARHPIEHVVAFAACRHGIKPHEIVSARRTKSVVPARRETYWLACEATPYSLPEIGQEMGGRDHTTVLHGRQRMEAMMANDPAYRSDMEAALDALRVVLRRVPKPAPVQPHLSSLQVSALRGHLRAEMRATISREIERRLAPIAPALMAAHAVAQRTDEFVLAQDTRGERGARERMDAACRDLAAAVHATTGGGPH